MADGRPSISHRAGDNGRSLHRKRWTEQYRSYLDNNSSSVQGSEDGLKLSASSAQNPVTSTYYEGHDTQEDQAIHLCRARHKGRVGTYEREGNVSLASFGIKFKKDKMGKKVDLTKSLSQMLPYVVLATAVAALTQPASFAW